MELCDVIIVGAGVAGLTLALACKSQGLGVVVLERDKSRNYRRQGYFLMLPDACVTAINDCCHLDPEGAMPVHIIDFDVEGKMPLLRHIPQSASQFGVKSGGCVPRGPLRNRMLDACILRGVDVRFDADVVDIEEHAEHTCAAVLNGGDRVMGRCLAGCDGINSRVRRWLAPGVEPESCGGVCMRGFALDDGAVRELAGQEPGSRSPTLGGVSTPPGLGMNMTLVGGKITWVVEFRHAAPEGLDVPGARRAVAKATTGFHPVLRKLVLEDTADEAVHVEVLQDLGRWSGPFGRGLVTLLGDAAHPSVWFGGGGRGIVDAVELATAFGHAPLQGDLQERLRAAEAAMQIRAPVEESLKMRERLPSAIGAVREEQYRKAEASRLVRWEKSQVAQVRAKF